MGPPGGKGQVLSNTAHRAGALSAANQRQREQVSRGKKTTCSVCFYNSKMSQFRKLRNLAKGRATSFLLNWFGIFPPPPWFMEMTACNAACMQCRWLVAILSVVVFPSRGQGSLPSCKEASLHPQNPLCFDLAGKGLFLKLFRLAQILPVNQVLKFLHVNILQ